jgi:hypothetical protein
MCNVCYLVALWENMRTFLKDFVCNRYHWNKENIILGYIFI